MRSGLQNPGAIPLLAVLVASLFSLMPIVCEALGKLEDFPGIGHSVGSSIYPMVNFVPARSEHAMPSSRTSGSGSNSIISTCNHIDSLWQQVCLVVNAVFSSSKQQDAGTIHNMRHTRLDPGEILDLSPYQNFLRLPGDDGRYNDNDNSNNNSTNSPPMSDSASITISLASLSGIPANKNELPPSSLQPSSSDNYSSASPQPEIAVVNASSPVDRKSSYMAILISLVVAIIWL